MNDGFWKLEAVYTNGYQLVVCGSPPDDSHLPDELQHNCDAAGCSSVEHVLARIPLMQPYPEIGTAPEVMASGARERYVK